MDYSKMLCVAEVDDATVAIGCLDGSIKLYRWTDSQFLCKAGIGHSAEIQCLMSQRWWPQQPPYQGTIIVSGSLDGTIKRWRFDDMSCIETLQVSSPVLSLCDIDRRTIVAGTSDATLCFWQLDGQDEKKKYSLVKRLLSTVAVGAGINAILQMKDGSLVTWERSIGVSLWKNSVRQGREPEYYMQSCLISIPGSQCLLKLKNNDMFAVSQGGRIAVWNSRGELLCWMTARSEVSQMLQLRNGSLLGLLASGHVETWNIFDRF